MMRGRRPGACERCAAQERLLDRVARKSNLRISLPRAGPPWPDRHRTDKATRESITLWSDEELKKEGSHHAAADLDAQALATFELALSPEEKKPIETEIGPKLIPAAEIVRVLVKATGDDRVVAKGSSKGKTIAEGKAERAAKEWRRKAMRAGRNLLLRGVKEASALSKITANDQSEAKLREEVEQKAKLLETYAPKALVPATALALAALGVKLAKDLSSAGAIQDVEIKNLPLKTQEEYLQKGILLCALKLINNTGWSIHAANLKSAGRYNLEILYRGDDKGKGGGGPPPTK